MSAPDGWLASLRAHRERRDDFFSLSAESPLDPAAQASFDGLDHYEPDPAYRFVVPLHQAAGERVTVETTADGTREYAVAGEFRFEIDGESCSLTAYRHDPEAPTLWVPFRDATSGETTYPAGRYLDLDADDHRTDEGWVVDFNYGYSPFCAYSEAYECPLVPPSNHLDVAVEAGERYEE